MSIAKYGSFSDVVGAAGASLDGSCMNVTCGVDRVAGIANVGGAIDTSGSGEGKRL